MKKPLYLSCNLMKNKKFKFTVGEKTTNIWCGDVVTECEFLADLESGQMLFYDVKSKCFRKVFIDVSPEGEPYMNGWNCESKPSKLINKT